MSNGGALPPGWSSAKDPSSGNTYYYHQVSGAVQWTAPQGAPAPPPGGGGSRFGQAPQAQYAAANPSSAEGQAYAAVQHAAAPQRAAARPDDDSPADVMAWRAEHEITVAGGCKERYATRPSTPRARSRGSSRR
ncbi:hypothetical protein SO694_00043060 [Aureococcus anophagefferens]|uniref:WW domain-containing protein n=1 Tax=Aureococcus anophagefferens TaxID=44056 RepID=A0ABR1G709_AURAN